MSEPKVATREGGVDRNMTIESSKEAGSASPPARVAWIETLCSRSSCQNLRVATREGGVDRNTLTLY